MSVAHKFLPETTNGGCCFCDCSCGWSGGVYDGRASARSAHSAHLIDKTLEVGKMHTEFLIAPAGSTVDGTA